MLWQLKAHTLDKLSLCLSCTHKTYVILLYVAPALRSVTVFQEISFRHQFLLLALDESWDLVLYFSLEWKYSLVDFPFVVVLCHVGPGLPGTKIYPHVLKVFPDRGQPVMHLHNSCSHQKRKLSAQRRQIIHLPFSLKEKFFLKF